MSGPEIVVHRTIRAPLEVVFRTVADVHEFTRASPFVRSVDVLSVVTGGVGLRFRERRAYPAGGATAEVMRLPRSVYAFTLPLGAQPNKDGTSIMLMAVVLYTVQAAGVQLAAGDLFARVLMGLLLSAGSGGIPAGGFVAALILVESFGLPLEPAAIVGGIYRLVDMGNTTVNVMGAWWGPPSSPMRRRPPPNEAEAPGLCPAPPSSR